MVATVSKKLYPLSLTVLVFRVTLVRTIAHSPVLRFRPFYGQIDARQRSINRADILQAVLSSIPNACCLRGFDRLQQQVLFAPDSSADSSSFGLLRNSNGNRTPSEKESGCQGLRTMAVERSIHRFKRTDDLAGMHNRISVNGAGSI